MDDRERMLAIVKQLCAGDFAALGYRAIDAAETAFDGDDLPAPQTPMGKENNHWVLVEHVFATAGFVKLVWDLYVSACKQGRSPKKEEIATALAKRRILMPGDKAYEQALAEIEKASPGA
jgi:hypothetical protein